ALVPGHPQHVCVSGSWLMLPSGLVRYQLRSSIERYKSFSRVCQVGSLVFCLWSFWGGSLAFQWIYSYLQRNMSSGRRTKSHLLYEKGRYDGSAWVARWQSVSSTKREQMSLAAVLAVKLVSVSCAPYR